MKDIRAMAQQIREKIAIDKQESLVNKQSTKPVMPRTSVARGRDRSVRKLRDQMEGLGVDMEDTGDAHFTKTRGRSRSLSGPARKKQRVESVVSTSRARSSSRPARDEMGVKDVVVIFFSLNFATVVCYLIIFNHIYIFFFR